MSPMKKQKAPKRLITEVGRVGTVELTFKSLNFNRHAAFVFNFVVPEENDVSQFCVYVPTTLRNRVMKDLKDGAFIKAKLQKFSYARKAEYELIDYIVATA